MGQYKIAEYTHPLEDVVAMHRIADKRHYEKPVLETCGFMTEQTRSIPTYCHCTNPIEIPGLPGKWCDVDDCVVPDIR
jgi:hypothetical protein